jgi:hypothetical protein
MTHPEINLLRVGHVFRTIGTQIHAEKRGFSLLISEISVYLRPD